MDNRPQLGGSGSRCFGCSLNPKRRSPCAFWLTGASFSKPMKHSRTHERLTRSAPSRTFIAALKQLLCESRKRTSVNIAETRRVLSTQVYGELASWVRSKQDESTDSKRFSLICLRVGIKPPIRKLSSSSGRSRN